MPLGRRPFRTIDLPTGRITLRSVRAYALVELGDSEAIDLFFREDDAHAALEEAIRDEPDWAGLLCVEEIEVDERDVSVN
jgi:hypothetical protein